MSAHYTVMRQDLASSNRGFLTPPTPTTLRMRIAETRILQHRVAARLDISDGHLSHILAGNKRASDEFLTAIAEAIEAVVASADAPAA